MEWSGLKRDIAGLLARCLNETLPEIGGANWWRFYVLDELTPAQRGQVKGLSDPDLFQLDMAALLRLFDRNWSELSFKLDLPRTGRNLVRELMAIRNRWAHEPAGGQPPEDLFRDLDTVKRFLQIIKPNDILIGRVEDLRLVALEAMTDSMQSDAEISGDEIPAPELEANDSAVTGAPLALIGASQLIESEARNFAERLGHTAYIGIDFGTSTTVVSYISLDVTSLNVRAEPMPISQFLPDGRRSRSHLIPSCIALNPSNGKVLFGLGAKELQYQLREGIDVWSSFKMELGIDVGPKYRNTRLPNGADEIYIETPQDAAREFFKFLKQGIDNFLHETGLPANLRVAVSVPASFEANQRKDLLAALAAGGFVLDDSCLVDEPNAAFLSVLHDSWQEDGQLMIALNRRPKNILVFDFGAGTCDISILKVSVSEGVIHSRNLAISRFLALGGDNIDRAIAAHALLPQMLQQSRLERELLSEQVEQIVIPRLMSVAERLKIQCSKALRQRGLSTIDDCSALGDSVTDHRIPELRIGGQSLYLDDPKLSYLQFAEVMTPFVTHNGEREDEDDVAPPSPESVLGPIRSALEKANLQRDQIDAVLFIGGSSENPIVQGAIRNHFGRFVDAIVPRDLRSHVSKGATLHSFARHAFNTTIVQPITSEPILLVTASGGLEPILVAGSEVPSAECVVSRFKMQRDGQERIELPICVTSEEKILGVIFVSPEPGRAFMIGDEVVVSCSMTADKLLEVKTTVGDRATAFEVLNPLANRALSGSEMQFLKAQQKFNRAVLAGRGRPQVSDVIAYAAAASRASRFLLAAELFEQAERLDPDRDFSVNICFNYDRANRSDLAEIWAENSYQRDRSPVTAFNLAIFKYRRKQLQDAKRYALAALALDPVYPAAQVLLGDIQDALGEGGEQHFESALGALASELEDGVISEDDCYRLARIAKRMGKVTISKQAELAAARLRRDQELYRDENLVARADILGGLVKE